MTRTESLSPMLRVAGVGPRRRTTVLYVAIGFLALVAIVAVFAPLLRPYDPAAVDFAATDAAPGTAGHLLGTDQNGRDILSRLIEGSRISLLGPLAVTIISTVLGLVIGGLAGWRGGWLDNVLSRMTDFMFAFPGLLLAVFAAALFGPGIVAPAIALGIAFTPMGARLARGLVRQERSKDYVQSLRVLGFSGQTIFVKHVFPVIAPQILSQSLLGFGYAVVDLAAISYLGLGVQPPTADWGVMIAEGQQSILSGSIWPVFWPALIIVLVVVCFNYVGEHVIERFNRRLSA